MAARRFAFLPARAAAPVVAALGLACGSPSEPPRHLLLITVDTLRADRIGTYGAPPDVTPNLDGLAWVSTVFERAYAPTPFTLPSVSGILTGRHPEALGISENRSVLPAEVPTLATLLQDAGFRTAAVVSNFVLREKAGLTRGFEHYDAILPQREISRDIPERTAAPATAAALAAFDSLRGEGDDRIFLWVHYQDPHGPYTAPEALRERYLPVERAADDGDRTLPLGVANTGVGSLPRYQQIGAHRDAAYYRAGYSAEVRYVDEHIGRLLVGLSDRGSLDDTVVIVAADHGESLGEDDYWFAHGSRLHDTSVRVPLIIRVPGRAAARRDDPASLLDLMPTVAALFQIPAPPGARGRDLLAPPPAEPAPIYIRTLAGESGFRRALILADRKYVVSVDSDGPVEFLFEDSDETRNLAADRPDQVEAMRRRLADVRAAIAPVAIPAPTQSLSPEEDRMLSELGYVETTP